MIELAGSVGIDTYCTVKDLDMAPAAILGMITGDLGAPTGRMYNSLGKSKRDMSPEMKNNMGDAFKKMNTRIEKIPAKMCKRIQGIQSVLGRGVFFNIYQIYAGEGGQSSLDSFSFGT